MHDHDLGNGYAPHQGIAHLSHALERTLDQNRMLFAQMAQFTKDETLRLAHLQLEHADQAFAQFRHRQDLAGLIGAQQEWFRAMMQGHAEQSLRCVEMFHTLTRQVQTHVETAVGELQDHVKEKNNDRRMESVVDLAHAATGERTHPQAG